MHLLVVKNTARGTDKDITPLLQDFILLPVSYTTKETSDREVFDTRSKEDGIFLNLNSQFTGWSNNQCLRFALSSLYGLDKRFKNRQHIHCGFSASSH